MTAARLANPAAEVRRLRKSLDAAHHELALLQAELTHPESWWLEVFRDIHRADVENAYRQGREDMAREYEQTWSAIARPISRSGPAFAELEIRRWGPGGRAHFGDARPGDFMGGPVPQW